MRIILELVRVDQSGSEWVRVGQSGLEHGLVQPELSQLNDFFIEVCKIILCTR